MSISSPMSEPVDDLSATLTCCLDVAARDIENTRYELYIVLVNDLTVHFIKPCIGTLDVLEAADTKWSFVIFLTLWLALKEKCKVLRNRQKAGIVFSRECYNDCVVITIHALCVDAAEAQQGIGISLIAALVQRGYEALTLAVGHQQFCGLGGYGVLRNSISMSVVNDVNYILPLSNLGTRL